MPGKILVRRSSITFIIPLFSALFAFAGSASAAQNVTISWNQPSFGEAVAAYRLYQDNLLLCETSDPAARQITCPAVLSGSSVFSVVAVYGDVSSTGGSTPTTTDPAAGDTPTTGTGSASDPATGSGSGGTTTGSTPDPVVSGNQIPLVNDLTFSVGEDGSISDRLSGSDADGDALTYTILAAPARGAVELLNTATGEFRYTPDPDVTGGDSFSYSVSDGKDVSDSATVNVTVLPVNDLPVANAGPDQAVNEGGLVTLDATNSYDIDGDPLTVSWVQIDGPTVTLSDPNAPQPQFAAIDVGVAGATLTFQLTVTDAQGLEATDVAIVNIVAVNAPPAAAAGEDQRVYEGDTVVLDASGATDGDDGIVAYSWVQLSGPEMVLSDSTAMQPSFKAPNVDQSGASMVFEVTVTDFGGLYTKDTVIINVSWVNSPPVADAGVDQSVNAGDVVTLDGTLSHDEDDGIAKAQWLQTAGVPVTLSNPTVFQPTFTAPTGILEPVTLAFELVVTDYSGLQHTDNCTVLVSPLKSVGRGRVKK